ncbi:RNA 2',3'-cyclic phosphodiesterase [Methylophaga sulfidovorans]|uniref:RNA 2',3'-cyclic phosphodiesterase n=1 Tax=Methylophaga sulfidovorans TaxID=45496 RepID=UPI000B8A1E6C|nr:RNA 2',3'-cyclic phosphodiesterase [Methylophaga sulfidovorans]
MRRVFFALWPDDDIRSRFSYLSDQFEQPGLRKLKPSNFHMTLFFVGNVEDHIVVTLLDRAKSIRSFPISLEFNELDYWRKPKVLCLTCQKQPSSLYHLVNALNRMMSGLPITRETRPFRAHITLARKAKYRPDMTFKPVRLSAERFALVESISTTDGVEYRVLESWPLPS